MTTDEFDPSDLPVLDDRLIRNTAEEVKVTARRAHRVEVALVAVAAALIILIAGFTGWNTYRLRDVNTNLTNLVEAIETNQLALQAYNEGHAESTAYNLDAILTNIECFTGFFVMFNEALASGEPTPAKAVLDACFKPAAPAPLPEPLPSDNGDEEEGDGDGVG